MKLIVKELFEQGLPRNQGGMVRLRAGEYAAQQSEHGLVVNVDGKARTLPPNVVENLKALGLVSVE
jgi:hypothetical protein